MKVFLYGLGLVAAVIAGAAAEFFFFQPKPETTPVSSPAAPVLIAFEGTHQAGIATPQPSFAMVSAFDLTTKDVAELKALFQTWTKSARLLTQGKPLKDDTGEAAGYGPSRLTVTFGVGPGIFDKRFGLTEKRPAALARLPEFPNDDLHKAWSDGDLIVQVCGDDFASVYSAMHNLSRQAAEVAEPRWIQSGFLPTAQVGAKPVPRNLQGFHDGTETADPANAKTMDDIVWAGDEGPAWMVGGSYLVVRRIRIFVENWSRIGVLDQERVIGRERATGTALVKQGDDSHVKLAKGTETQKIFRRPYSYFNGLDEESLQWDAGLLFLAWQKDPRTQFVPIQTRLSEYDSLNEYTQAVGSAVFAVFPGVGADGFVGQGLFE